MFTYYNNESIRKLVVAFGSLFNNVHLMQKDKNGANKDIVVPLTYSSKEKYIKRLTLPSSISDQTRVEITLPQLSFEMTNITYDPVRHLNKIHKKQQSTTGLTGDTSYMEVPYNFTFSVYAYTRNVEENLQIMEQILPNFSPEFIVSLNYTNIHKKVDVPITLVQTNLLEDYDGDFSNRRMVVSSYVFTAKSYVFGRIKSEYNVTSYQGIGEILIDGITFGVTGP